MQKYCFTFGMSHPMAHTGIIIDASSEEVARLAMSKMVNHWCGCYGYWDKRPDVNYIHMLVTADAFLADADFR